MRCPLCDDETPELAEAIGALHEHVCRQCQGRHLPTEALDQLLEEEGLERETLFALGAHFGGRGGPCAECEGQLLPIQLRGATLRFCPRCGGAWLPRGALAQLSGGRHAEVQADPPEITKPKLKPKVAHTGTVAILLAEARHPDPKALASAIAMQERLTVHDVDNAFGGPAGVLFERLTPDEGQQLERSLQAAGVGCLLVDEAVLRLPEMIPVVRVQITNGALIRWDAGGEAAHIPWSEIRAFTAGSVGFKTSRSGPRLEKRPRALRFGPVNKRYDVVHDLTTTTEVSVELVHGDEQLVRIRLRAGTVIVLGPDEENLPLLKAAGLMAQRMDAAALGLGARAARKNAAHEYRHQRDVDRELAWLVWRGQQESDK